jgi:hypothetical protein
LRHWREKCGEGGEGGRRRGWGVVDEKARGKRRVGEGVQESRKCGHVIALEREGPSSISTTS